MLVNPLFTKLMGHVGHRVVVVYYGKHDGIDTIPVKNAVNVSIECETCDCILISEDKFPPLPER